MDISFKWRVHYSSESKGSNKDPEETEEAGDSQRTAEDEGRSVPKGQPDHPEEGAIEQPITEPIDEPPFDGNWFRFLYFLDIPE